LCSRWRRKRKAREHKPDEKETASQRRPASRISYWRSCSFKLNRLIHNGPPFSAGGLSCDYSFDSGTGRCFKNLAVCQYENYGFYVAGFSSAIFFSLIFISFLSQLLSSTLGPPSSVLCLPSSVLCLLSSVFGPPTSALRHPSSVL